jgi:pimeloyl-ACP methyl ester carboxylesterase
VHRFANANSVRLHYIIGGPAGGETVVLLHGFLRPLMRFARSDVRTTSKPTADLRIGATELCTAAVRSRNRLSRDFRRRTTGYRCSVRADIVLWGDHCP